MTISPTDNVTPNVKKPAPPPPEEKMSKDYQLFLKMLTTQMKNQDPLNPIESSDYAVQLATFSGVEQQVKTNDLLTKLTGQLGVTAMGQYAGWVGMEACSTAPVVFSGTALTLYPTPAAGADKTVLVAYDSQNREVMRQEIPVFGNSVQWTGSNASGGQVMNGTYSFRLESYEGGKLKQTDKVEAFSKITEVRQGISGPILVLAGGATTLPAEVKALRPGATP